VTNDVSKEAVRGKSGDQERLGISVGMYTYVLLDSMITEAEIMVIWPFRSFQDIKSYMLADVKLLP
jgi:hypothetical protein